MIGSPARWMRRALALAKRAAERGEVPIGAVLVRDGRFVCGAANAVETSRDATEHAEMRVLRRAARRLGTWRLTGCELYVTKEPCPMCAAAAALARIDRLYFGARDPGAGACGSRYSIAQDGSLRHRVRVHGSILAEDGAALLTEFFRARRGAKLPGNPTESSVASTRAGSARADGRTRRSRKRP